MLLSRGFPDGQGQATDGLELKKTVEAYLEDKAQTLLDGVLGPGKSVIRISALLNLERIERSIERFDPESAVVRSEERSEGDGGDGGSRSETSVTNYELDRTVEVGNIERLSVAVMVDGTYQSATGGAVGATKQFVPRSDEELAKIAGIVKSAVGFDGQRNDYFEIASIAFDRTFLEEEEQGMQKMLRMQFYLSIARKAAYLGGLILALILVLKLVKKTAAIIGAASRGRIDLTAGGAPLGTGAGGQSVRGSNEVAAQIANLATQNPDQAAGLIRAMVSEGE
jgi:flagellar M-ring protein FliF